MNRLVRTSTGWVALDLSRIAVAGITCRVTAFNGDAGWAAAARGWNERDSDVSLPELVAQLAGIPSNEAEEIVDETLSEWRARGGEDADRKESRETVKYLVGTFGLAALGAVALLGVVAWLVASWL